MDKARHRNDRLLLIGALVLCALLFFCPEDTALCRGQRR